MPDEHDRSRIEVDRADRALIQQGRAATPRRDPSRLVRRGRVRGQGRGLQSPHRYSIGPVVLTRIDQLQPQRRSRRPHPAQVASGGGLTADGRPHRAQGLTLESSPGSANVALRISAQLSSSVRTPLARIVFTAA